MENNLPPSIKEPLTPLERLTQKQQVNSTLEEARQLLKEKLYKAALKKFKWVVANDSSSKTHISGKEILKLIKNYPPAQRIVRQWRNDKERLLLAQKADFILTNQWCTLNSCLKEEERTLKIFLKLKEAGTREKILNDILHKLWKKLARAKKYEPLKSYLPYLGFNVLLAATEYDSIKIFPRTHGLTVEQAQRLSKSRFQSLIEDGPLQYEVALGLKEMHVADVFAQKILGVETSDRVYASLIRATIRARAYPEAIALYDRARSQFTLRRLQYTNKVIKTLPKKQLELVFTSAPKKCNTK